MGSTGMNLPTTPQATIMKCVGVVLVIGLIYSYGYFKGYESQAKAYAKALEKALEDERAVHKEALKKAEEDARRLSQAASRASTAREEYKRVEPSEVSPVDCISGDQRLFIRGLVEPQG